MCILFYVEVIYEVNDISLKGMNNLCKIIYGKPILTNTLTVVR